jgi:hypothetical protein
MAIAYDFDGTLASGNIQENSFIPAIKMSKAAFWQQNKARAEKHEADEVLSYMTFMLERAAAEDVPVRRQDFADVVGREEKYKAKNLIDVVIYRGSDALYGWVYDSLQALGLKLGAIAICALPVTVGWLFLSTALGRTQERLAAESDDQGVPAWQSK